MFYASAVFSNARSLKKEFRFLSEQKVHENGFISISFRVKYHGLSFLSCAMVLGRANRKTVSRKALLIWSKTRKR